MRSSHEENSNEIIIVASEGDEALAPGAVFQITDEADSITGTAGDDTINGSQGWELGWGDTIVGGDGIDTVVINSNNQTGLNLANAAKFQEVEGIVINSLGASIETNADSIKDVKYIEFGPNSSYGGLALQSGIYDLSDLELVRCTSIALLQGARVTFDDKAMALLAGDGDGLGDKSITLSSGFFSAEERSLLFSRGMTSITDTSGTYSNQPPVIANLGGDVGAVQKGQTVLLDQGGNATLTDEGLLQSLSVVLWSGEWRDGQDQLGIKTRPGVVDVVNGIVSIQGVQIGTIVRDGSTADGLLINFNNNATAARIEILIRALAYTNTGTDIPSTGDRQFAVLVTDEHGVSDGYHVVKVEVHDPEFEPTLTVTPREYEIADTETVRLFEDAVVSDPDSPRLSLFVRIDDPAKGALTGFSVGAYSARTGMYSFFGTAEEIQNALQSLVFRPTDRSNGAGTIETTSFTISVGDDDGYSVRNSTVTVKSVNESAKELPTSVLLSDNAIREFPFEDDFIGDLTPNLAGDYVYRLVLKDEAGNEIGTATTDGRFKIVDGKLLNATRVGLDFEQAADHAITVRIMKAGATGAGDWRLDTDYTIAVTDVYGENVTGTGAGERILANVGNDVLSGGGGNDTLAGGVGRDTLKGDAGNDMFRFDTRPNAVNRDTIVDFVSGEDQIQLQASIFGLGALRGDLTAARFYDGTGTLTAQHRIIYEKTATTARLYFDPDGSGATARFEIASFTVNKPTLTLADFDIIA